MASAGKGLFEEKKKKKKKTRNNVYPEGSSCQDSSRHPPRWAVSWLARPLGLPLGLECSRVDRQLAGTGMLCQLLKTWVNSEVPLLLPPTPNHPRPGLDCPRLAPHVHLKATASPQAAPSGPIHYLPCISVLNSTPTAMCLFKNSHCGLFSNIF